ncbi:MAG: EAL domain-containing protein [Pseudomonadota bacterium]
MSESFTSVFTSITASFRERPPLVLIVDDEATIRLMTRRFLEHADFMVVDADSGEAAKAEIARIDPDIILLDVDMPGMDGYELTRWIRRNPSTRFTPIVMITGREDPESVDAAYEVGATDFIVKPIAWPVLSHRVRYILRGSQTQLALRESHSRVRAIIAALPDRLFSVDNQGQVIGDDKTLLNFDNVTTTTSIQSGSWSLFEHALRQQIERVVKDSIGNVLNSDDAHEHAISLPDEHNQMRHFEVRLVKQTPKLGLAVVRDVTQQKVAVNRIHQLAYYDALTGLPNRQYFSSELKNCMGNAKTRDEQFALLYVDLDHFKRINDTLGHTTGDELLKLVAIRLQTCLRTDDVVARADVDDFDHDGNIARLGGDEFTLIIRDGDAVDNIEHVASRIIEALKVPFEFSGHEFVVTPSIGIAIYPTDGEDEESLLKSADVAMYQAKQAGRSGYSFCTETTTVRSLDRLDLELEIRRALDAGGFELHYQPKVEAGSWKLIGAEALLRWNHAERGWIPPSNIIPIAEDTGLIVPMGRWIINEACRQMAQWRDQGLPLVPISVNLSSQQFWQDDIASVVEAAVGQYDLDSHHLELELTEGVLMRDVQQTRIALQTLKETGITLAVDDFGTGYSSLAYLRQFPLDALKIDRSFVDDLPDGDAAAICNAIISMAHNLTLKVVAEGVENPEQLNYLHGCQCDQIQGYYFSKPLAADSFAPLLTDSREFARLAAACGNQSTGTSASVAASASAR